MKQLVIILGIIAAGLIGFNTYESIESHNRQSEIISQLQSKLHNAPKWEYGLNVTNDSIMVISKTDGGVATVHMDTISRFFSMDNQ